MKKLFFMLLVFTMSMPAMAGVIFYADNSDGGRIEFTDQVCPRDESFLFVSTYVPSGQVLTGCYIIDTEQQISVVVWDDNTIYRYPLDVMSVTPYFQKKYMSKSDAMKQQL